MTMPEGSGLAEEAGPTMRPVLPAIDLAVEIELDNADEASTISASIRLPAGLLDGDRVSVLVCWPGGSYGKTYWDMRIPGHADYSFAEHLASRGFVVVSADFLGVGESSRPARGHDASFATMTRASSAFVTAIKTGLGAGTLADGHVPLTLGPVLGIGHSLGGFLVIAEQAMFSTYDAVAALGSNHGVKERSVPGSGEAYRADAQAAAEQAEVQAKAFFGEEQFQSGYGIVDRLPHHGWLHGPEVPDDVVAADDAEVVPWPCRAYVEALTPGLTASYARLVVSPVFVGFGEHDVPEHPHDDVGFYESSNDVTLVVLPDSYHCHNFATRRKAFWDRIALWANDQEAHATEAEH